MTTSPGGVPASDRPNKNYTPSHTASSLWRGEKEPESSDFPSSPCRAGYLDEDQMEMLLERAQTETFSIKQKLDNDLKQEKKRLHQKLVTKRRRELLQKVCEALCSLSLQKPPISNEGIAIRTG